MSIYIEIPAFTDDIHQANFNGYYYAPLKGLINKVGNEISLHIDTNSFSKIMPDTHIYYSTGTIFKKSSLYFYLKVKGKNDPLMLENIIIKNVFDIEWLQKLIVLIIKYTPECRTHFYIYNSAFHHYIHHLPYTISSYVFGQLIQVTKREVLDYLQSDKNIFHFFSITPAFTDDPDLAQQDGYYYGTFNDSSFEKNNTEIVFKRGNNHQDGYIYFPRDNKGYFYIDSHKGIIDLKNIIIRNTRSMSFLKNLLEGILLQTEDYKIYQPYDTHFYVYNSDFYDYIHNHLPEISSASNGYTVLTKKYVVKYINAPQSIFHVYTDAK